LDSWPVQPVARRYTNYATRTYITNYDALFLFHYVILRVRHH